MVLIKDTIVVDGTGADAQRADVLINGDRIVAIGNLKNHDAQTVVDGLGTILTPGFIDVNTDSDHYLSLFSDPLQQDFLLQGVTTIIGGHCGSSLAPLIYGTLESIRKWGDTTAVNVDWNTMAEFLKTLERIKLGVNFGTLVGHSTVRRAISGENEHDLTERETQVLLEVLERSLKEGALGISTGLGYSHGKAVPFAEVKKVAALAKKYKGVYATHLRDEKEGVEKAVDEIVKVATDTGAKTLISHFRPIAGFETHYETALKTLESSKADIHFDLYPFNYSILPLYTLLPAWAQKGSLEKMNEQLATEHLREEVIRDIPTVKSGDLIIARATGFDYLVGKTIGEFSKAQGLTIKQGLVKLMEITKLKAVLFYKNINLGVAQNALISEHALIASNSPSLVDSKNVLENERAKRTFTEFLHLLSKFKKKNLEWAVKKITSIPAQKMGLKNRGVIKEGMIADLVMMRPMVPNAPLGGDNRIVNVFVNGQLAVKEGKTTGVRVGSIINRS